MCKKHSHYAWQPPLNKVSMLLVSCSGAGRLFQARWPAIACEATYSVQVGSTRLQVTAWFNASLPVRRLPTCLGCRPPSAPFIWCLHVCRPSHSDGFPWQSFPSRWTWSLEQSTGLIAAVRHHNLPLQETAKDSFVCWYCGALVTFCF